MSELFQHRLQYILVVCLQLNKFDIARTAYIIGQKQRVYITYIEGV